MKGKLAPRLGFWVDVSHFPKEWQERHRAQTPWDQDGDSCWAGRRCHIGTHFLLSRTAPVGLCFLIGAFCSSAFFEFSFMETPSISAFDRNEYAWCLRHPFNTFQAVYTCSAYWEDPKRRQAGQLCKSVSQSRGCPGFTHMPEAGWWKAPHISCRQSPGSAHLRLYNH